jgi:hypothetical protein
MKTIYDLEREIRMRFPQLEANCEKVGGAARVNIVRKRKDGSFRYLLISLVNDPEGELPPETFSIIGGEHRNADPNADFDGRQWGDYAYTIAVINQWLIDLVANWSELPRK